MNYQIRIGRTEVPKVYWWTGNTESPEIANSIATRFYEAIKMGYPFSVSLEDIQDGNMIDTDGDFPNAFVFNPDEVKRCILFISISKGGKTEGGEKTEEFVSGFNFGAVDSNEGLSLRTTIYTPDKEDDGEFYPYETSWNPDHPDHDDWLSLGDVFLTYEDCQKYCDYLNKR